jgi:hypothetical protein
MVNVQEASIPSLTHSSGFVASEPQPAYSTITVETRSRTWKSKGSENVSVLPSGGLTQNAALAKAAGRVTASVTTEVERQSWLAERAQLLDLKFSGKATVSDLKRLQYVRWNLDLIDDARYGADLDVLESKVVVYERTLEKVTALAAQLERLARTKSR